MNLSRVLSIFLYLAVMVFVFSVIVSPAFAETPQESSASTESTNIDNEVKITDVEGLRLELIQNTQDPGSKDVQFDLIIKSAITSDRVQITWQLEGVSEAVTATEETLSISSGQTYTASFVVKPRAFGTTKVTAVVEAFQVDGTKIATASKTIGSYEDGEVFPPTEQHNLAKTLYLVRQIAIIFAVIVGGALGGYVGYHKFRSWLNDRST